MPNVRTESGSQATLLPGTLFVAVGGMLFGTLLGTVYAMIGSFLACAVVFGLARKLGVEPESALRRANDKFVRRFQAVERGMLARGRSVRDASLEELEAEWQRVTPTNQSLTCDDVPII